MRTRNKLVALTLAALALWPATAVLHPANAQAQTAGEEPAVSTTTLPSAEGIGSILGPRPGGGVEPEDAGDRGGSAQLATFWVMLLALGLIAFFAVRDIKRNKARNLATSNTNKAGEGG